MSNATHFIRTTRRKLNFERWKSFHDDFAGRMTTCAARQSRVDSIKHRTAIMLSLFIACAWHLDDFLVWELFMSDFYYKIKINVLERDWAMRWCAFIIPFDCSNILQLKSVKMFSEYKGLAYKLSQLWPGSDENSREWSNSVELTEI